VGVTTVFRKKRKRLQGCVRCGLVMALHPLTEKKKSDMAAQGTFAPPQTITHARSCTSQRAHLCSCYTPSFCLL
jgi:hypothetical protein